MSDLQDYTYGFCLQDKTVDLDHQGHLALLEAREHQEIGDPLVAQVHLVALVLLEQ